MVPDPRALKILFSTYWSSSGWRPAHTTPPEDFAYAKGAGLMFDPATVTHDEMIERALAARRRIKGRQVGEAFLASLGARRPEWRSALGSWAFLRHLRRHAHAPSDGGADDPCVRCGLYPSETVDWSVLNFERHKWGGVGHDQVEYAAFDLERFAAGGPVVATPADRVMLAKILAVAESCSSQDTATRLVSRLTRAKLPPGSRQQREVLVDILGLCGVLRVPGRPSYVSAFTPWCSRDLPPSHYVDRAYPVCWWRGEGGVDRIAAVAVFGP